MGGSTPESGTARRPVIMAEIVTTEGKFVEAPPRISEWRRIWRIFFQRKIVIFGLVILFLLVFTAIFANVLAPYDPYRGNMYDWLQQPSAKYLLGTDTLGRDTLSRLIYGTRIALLVGFVTTGVAAAAGTTLGLMAGYIGGLTNVIIALAIASLPGYARVMHGLSLSVRENDYIMAERAMGSSNIRTMLAHILPNALPPMIVMITLQLGGIILAEAGLSFLGIGIKPPGAAWGAMVNEGYKYLQTNPVLSFAPGLAIMLVVFAFNMVGDGLRDALDPRLRGII
jgi:peptide/nickel transport system permease protein